MIHEREVLNIKKSGDSFIVKYNKKVPGLNDSVEFTTNWRDVPRFRQDGTIKPPEEFMNEVIKSKGEMFFQQAYGNEFVGSSHTLLSSETIKNLKYSQPINKITPGLKIYSNPEKSHQYIMTIDAAKDGKDSFAVQIVDITGFKFKQVASAKLDVDYLIMPEIIDEWVRMYNNAFLIIENNEGAGQSIADQMYLTYEYENLYFDRKTESNSSNRTKSMKKYPGFRTTPKSRKLILQTMKTFIENKNLEIHDKDTINEFYTFILEKGKYQADDGCHDDMIMSLALVFAPFCNSKNFEDMKAIVDVIFRDHEDSEDIEVSEVMCIGGFDDGVDENEAINSAKNYRSLEEYYDDLDGFF